MKHLALLKPCMHALLTSTHILIDFVPTLTVAISVGNFCTHTCRHAHHIAPLPLWGCSNDIILSFFATYIFLETSHWVHILSCKCCMLCSDDSSGFQLRTTVVIATVVGAGGLFCALMLCLCLREAHTLYL